MSDFSIAGHGHIRVAAYTRNGVYESCTLPGGGLMLKQILSDKGCTVAQAEIAEPVARQHIGLIEDKAGGLGFGGVAGWEAGNRRLDLNQAEFAIVWDEGVDSIPAVNQVPVLWASNSTLPSPNGPFIALKNRCFLMLDADVLRSNGALISRQVSWERTATELVWQLRHNAAFGHLKGVADLLVVFAEDGAVHIRQEGEEWQASLVLAHGGFEGQLRDGRVFDVPDTWAVMVAQAAIELKNKVKNSGELNIYAIIKAGATLMQSGYCLETIRSGEFGRWLDSEEEEAYMFPIPVSNDESNPDPDYWCISASFQNKKMQELAYQYVFEGASVIEGVPQFRCGALTTVDRREIEAFQNIRNLIVSYASSKATRPLSIAVFGAPGSGKSFGVTQIAKNVLPGVVEKLEFNVSQMTSQSDLSAAFHRVRDVVLAGKLPLVFFDEFDSDYNGRALGWLKSFLMPMQDGKFKDDSGEHPVGKCIMVFAGGTSSSFERFCAPMKMEGPAFAEFKNVKGPDFVSRLRGTIDVLGPNPTYQGEQNYILRRALLLRSLLERKVKMENGKAPVSEDVLRAMLLVPQFKHGARSMESILDMSRIGARWEPAGLPFATQLALHVDADVFIRLVLRDVTLNAYTELLARAIHEDFLAKSIHETYLNGQEGVVRTINHVPWDMLSTEIQDSNREQARHIPQKLFEINCGFDSGDTAYETVEMFSEEEIMQLAVMEHDRWMAEKAACGWRYAPVRDDEKKLHNCLVDFTELPAEEQQKDVEVAKNIIPLLKRAGLRVYRIK